MEAFEEKVISSLFALQDIKYKEFDQKLIPTVDPSTVIGVRKPDLRKLAKVLFKESGYEAFLSALPHRYHEENFIHAMLIEQMKEFPKVIEETEKFLPYITNWEVCDSFSPKCFNKNKAFLLERIQQWLVSSDEYTVRFAVKMLMTHFLDDGFSKEYLMLVANVSSEEYYVRMMQAWFFATALAKQYDETLALLESNVLPVWVHNKTIQKAVESYRISDEQKQYLRTLKR